MKNNNMYSSNSEIIPFFDGKSVFITGVTGFMGKALLEKLLRTCTGIDKVYLFLRKRTPDDDTEKRLDDIINSELFCVLHYNQPSFASKLVAVPGDISLPNLGLSAVDEQMLIDNVNIVFHMAANVKFEEPIKHIINTNVAGTKRVIDLSYKMKHLSVFVHVSTAYANCEITERIQEKIYPSRYNPETIIETMNLLDDDLASAITPILLGKKPNTYAFAKTMSENLVGSHEGRLPLVIVRPSIVLSSYREPFPGWIDSTNGPVRLIQGVYNGIVRNYLTDVSKIVDLVPVDIANNQIIAAAWYTATYSPKCLQVFHSTSSELNPVSNGDFQYWTQLHMMRNPLVDSRMFPRCMYQTWFPRYWIEDFFYHFMCAAVLDICSLVRGQERQMIGLWLFMRKSMRVVSLYTRREWEFDVSRCQVLWNAMKEEDKRLFNFDVTTIHWPDYFCHFVIGVRKYVLRKPLRNREYALRRKHLQYYGLRCGQFIVAGIIFGVLFSAASYAICNMECFTVVEFIICFCIFYFFFIVMEQKSQYGDSGMWYQMIFKKK